MYALSASTVRKAMRGWIQIRDEDSGEVDVIRVPLDTDFDFFGQTVSPDSAFAGALLRAHPGERFVCHGGGRVLRKRVIAGART
jgi:transcription elongation GreA/GreB family factor